MTNGYTLVHSPSQVIPLPRFGSGRPAEVVVIVLLYLSPLLTGVEVTLRFGR